MTRRRGKLRTPLLVAAAVLMMLLAVLWRVPAWVAGSTWRDHIVTYVLGDSAAELSVSIDHASLGWFSPLVLDGVEIRDRHEQLLAQVPRVVTQKTAFGLLLDQSNLRDIRLEQPRLRARYRADGSDWEDVLGASLASEPATPLRVQGRLVISDGHLELAPASDVSGDRWSIAPLEGDVDFNTASARPLAAAGTLSLQKTTGHEQTTAADASRLAFQFEYRAAADGQSPAGWKGTMEAWQLPADLAHVALIRWRPSTYLTGVFTGKLRVEATDDTWLLALSQVEADQVVLRDADLLGTDQLATERLSATGTVALGPDRWQFSQVHVEGDFGHCRLDGSFASSFSPATMWNGIENAAIEAELDLAHLARLMPETLHLHEDLVIHSGRVTMQLASSDEHGSAHWSGTVRTSDLAGEHAGRPVVWEQPLDVRFAARQEAGGLLIDQLVCESSFLTIQANATPTSGRLTGRADLNRLAEELSQFADLADFQLAGTLDVHIDWKPASPQQWQMNGEAVVDGFHLEASGLSPWREPRLTLNVDARGEIDGGQLRQIAAGRIVLSSAEDRLEASLTDSVSLADQVVVWPARWQLGGDLSSWFRRLRIFFPLDGWEIAGKVGAQGNARYDGKQVAVNDTKATVHDLRVRGADLQIDEPVAQIELEGAWDTATHRLIGKSLLVQTATLSLQGRELVWQQSDAGVEMEGSASLRADLQRLSRWVVPAATSFRGMAEAQVTLAYSDQALNAGWRSKVHDLELLPSSEPARQGHVVPISQSSGKPWWSAPWIEMDGEGSLGGDGSVKLASLEFRSPSLGLRIQGQIERPWQDCFVQLTGEVDYDWQEVMPRLRSAFDLDVDVQGKGTRPFRLAGPLFAQTAINGNGRAPNQQALVSPQLQGEGSLGWQSGRFYGLPIGQGDLDAQLADAVVSVSPLDVAVGEGRLRLAPRFHLDQPPARVTLPAGPLIEGMQISPEMFHAWFKYVAPLLADATSAQGQFSVDLDGADWPLDDPARGTMRGQVQIDSARVGPGPLARELLTVAQQVRSILQRRSFDGRLPGGETWIDFPAQQVPFEMIEGRVYHQSLQMVMRDMVIRTHGSVGVDQSLDLIAEIPIRDEWVAGDRYLSSLRGEVLRVPIRGSITAPRMDRRVIEQLGNRLASDAAQRLLEQRLQESGVDQQLQRGLDRLFGPTERN